MSELIKQCQSIKSGVAASKCESAEVPRLVLMVLFLISFAITGCFSSKWTLNSDTSEKQLYWMEAPGTAKIKHFMSIKGFEEANSSIRTFIFGKGKSDLDLPVAFASGSDGRFAIADIGARCIHYYVPSEHRYLKLSTLDSTDLVSPVGVAFDDELRLYISDSALGKIFVIDKNGSFVSSISAAQGVPLKRPTGLAFDAEHKLLFAVDTLAHAISVFDK